MTDESQDPNVLLADVPIERPADDQLGRAPFAATLAKTIRSMRGTDSFVFGICGPWGCGKSSVLRMVTSELILDESESAPIVIDFNPWWFTGQNQLLASFLGQLSAVLGRRDAGAGVTKLGQRLGTLAKVLRPFSWIPGAEPLKQVGEALTASAEAAESLGERLSTDVHRLREEIDEELRKASRRIVIVMDDIDRLTASEISQLFVIVKAVADFPNTVYLLSYDHAVVCEAIREKLGLDGPAYLEKIVQIHVDVPPASPIALQQMFLGRLGELLDAENVTPATQKAFGNYFHGGIKPFFKTPRSVKSLTNVLRVLYPAVAGEVNWPDFVAITAMQVYTPDVYRTIRENKELFAGYDRDWSMGRNRDAEKAFHSAWLDGVPPDIREAVSDMVRRMFPKAGSALGGSSYGSDWASQWRAQLRICSPECFDRYFQFQVPTGAISEAEWSRFVSELESSTTVDEQIRSWCSDPGANRFTSRAKEFLDKASLFAEHGATVEQAKLLLSALLRNGDLLISTKDEDRSPGIPITNELRLTWAIQPLLEKFAEGKEREDVLEQLIQSTGLKTTAKLVWFFGAQHGLFGSEPNESHQPRHVSSECVDRLRAIALQKYEQAARDGSLADDSDALRLAREWKSFDDSGAAQAWVTKVCEDDQTLARFLVGVQSTTSSHAMDDYVATIGKSASADFLVWWFDGKELRRRCQDIVARNDSWISDEVREALQLVVDSIDEGGNALDPFGHRRRPREAELSETTTSEATNNEEIGRDDSEGMQAIS